MRKHQKSSKQMCDNSIQGLATIKKMELRKGELNTKLLERRLVQKSNLPDAFLNQFGEQLQFWNIQIPFTISQSIGAKM